MGNTQNAVDIELYNFYLNDCELSDKTKRLYGNVARNFFTEVADMENSDQIGNYLIDQVHHHNNNYYKYALVHLLKWKYKSNRAELNLLLEKLPVFKLQPHKRNTIRLEPNKIMELINNLQEEKHQVMAIIMMSTGMRIGDVINIKRDDIMLETYKEQPTLKIVTIGKGNKQSVTYITIQWIIDLILNYKNECNTFNEYLFLTTKQIKWTRRSNVIFTSSVGDNNPLNIANDNDIYNTDYVKVLKRSPTIDSTPGTILSVKAMLYNTTVSKDDFEKSFKKDFDEKNITWFNQNKIMFRSIFKAKNATYDLFITDLKQAQVSMGIPLDKWCAHDFRRCYAATVWETNKDIHLLMRQLNHSRAETTLLYLKNSALDRKDNDITIQNTIFNNNSTV